jgi:ribosomal protein S18 acetylase RimI-like enzyme
LGERIRTAGAAAETTFLAVRSSDGAVVAHVDLYVRDGYAQVEELMTAPAARGRGFGSALVVDAMHRAGGNRVFIVADLDEWPKQMYRRLGFADLGVIATFSRS